jgi:hypothetical protein
LPAVSAGRVYQPAALPYRIPDTMEIAIEPVGGRAAPSAIFLDDRDRDS